MPGPSSRSDGIGFLAFPCLVILAAMIAACGPSEAPSTTPDRAPNVLIYLVDTLRPDHLGIYGYDKPTSPRTDAFAEEGVVFRQAYTPASWTKPATASLLTGLLPYRHGAVTMANRIPEDVRLVSERLAERGYVTAAVVANAFVVGDWGFDQGYDHFDDVKARLKQSKAEVVVDETLAWLDSDERDESRPFYLYLHTIDPHGPYDPPSPFREQWVKKGPGKVILPRDLRPDTNPDTLARTREAYDGEIAYNDHHFGRLLDALKERGLYDNTLVIFVADHGEEFLDHGQGGHSRTLYQEVVRVPLIMRFPVGDHAGKSVKIPVTLMDAAATVLAAAGADGDGLDGMDLGPFVAGTAPLEHADRPLFFDLDIQRWGNQSINIMSGVLFRNYKLLLRTHPTREEALYSLKHDADETENLMDKESRRAGELRAALEASRLSAKSGIMLRVVNGGDKKARVFEGVLTTAGRFTHLGRSQLEEGDLVELGPEGRRIHFRLTARNYNNPSRRVPPFITDEDRLTFRVEPEDAEFTVERFGCSLPDGKTLHLGRDRSPAGALPLSFTADSDALLVEDAGSVRPSSLEAIDGTPAGGYLISVPGGARLSSGMSQEMEERLRALGYIK